MKVKGIIYDAYDLYQDLYSQYSSNAVRVLDNFHVVKFINQRISVYINEQLRKQRKIQQEKLKEKNEETNRDNQTIKDSQEIMLLRDYRWVLLEDEDHINYSR